MSRSLSLVDYMVKRPVKVRADDTILDAIEVILANSVSGALVVDEDDRLVGMLSEIDCLNAVMQRVYQDKQSYAGYVHEVMTREVETNKPSDDILAVATAMLDQKHRRRPIVDDDKLVGQVTCRQILGAIKDFSVPEV